MATAKKLWYKYKKSASWAKWIKRLLAKTTCDNTKKGGGKWEI